MSSADSWTVIGMLVAILLAFLGGYLMGMAIERDKKKGDDKDHGKWWESPEFWPRRPGGPTAKPPLKEFMGQSALWADAETARKSIQTSDEARKVFEKVTS